MAKSLSFCSSKLPFDFTKECFLGNLPEPVYFRCHYLWQVYLFKNNIGSSSIVPTRSNIYCLIVLIDFEPLLYQPRSWFTHPRWVIGLDPGFGVNQSRGPPPTRLNFLVQQPKNFTILSATDSNYLWAGDISTSITIHTTTNQIF